LLYSLAFATVMKLDWGAIALGYLGLLTLGRAFLAWACSVLPDGESDHRRHHAFSLLLLFWIIGCMKN